MQSDNEESEDEQFFTVESGEDDNSDDFDDFSSESDSDMDDDSSDFTGSDDSDQDHENYSRPLQQLINHFQEIERLRISKHHRYYAPLFDDADDEDLEVNVYRNIICENKNLKYLFF